MQHERGNVGTRLVTGLHSLPLEKRALVTGTGNSVQKAEQTLDQGLSVGEILCAETPLAV